MSFEGDFSEADVRTIHAFHVELKGSPPTPPIIKNELPILEIGQAVLHEEKRAVQPGAVIRDYVFEAKLKAKPPSGRTMGDVLVVDPWDHDHMQRIRVHIEARPPLRAIPPRVILRANADQSDRGASEEILILSKIPASDLVVELEGNETSPLTIGPIREAEGDRRATFSVGLKPEAIREGEYNILVRRSTSTDRVIIPVAVHVEDPR